MRKLICFLLVLLFVGTHGLPNSNMVFADSSPEQAQQPMVSAVWDVANAAGSGAVLTARQKCCGGEDFIKTSSNTPCSSDCSFTGVTFDLEFAFGGVSPAFDPEINLNAAFRHALFRPPIV